MLDLKRGKPHQDRPPKIQKVILETQMEDPAKVVAGSEKPKESKSANVQAKKGT